MNRREALATATAAITAAVPGTEAETLETKKPLMVVIKCKKRLTEEHMANLRREAQRIQDDVLKGLPVIVVPYELDVELLEDPR